MWLQPLGVVESGVATLDIGVTDFEVFTSDQGTFLLASTGRNGGITSYLIQPDGTLQLHDTQPFGNNVSFASGDQLTLAEIDGTTVLFFGANSAELVGYVVHADGSLGRVYRLPWEDAEAAIGNGTPELLRSWLLHGDTAPPMMPQNGWLDDTTAVGMVVNGSGSFLVTFGAQENQITSLFRNLQNGEVTVAGSIGAAQGLGISAPSALETVEAWGQSWVIVAAAGTSSLSVMWLGADGTLTPTDHVIDTGATAFAQAQDVAIAQWNDHVFVVAGGGDHGITLFALMPNGQLVWLDTLHNGFGTAFHNVSAISAVVDGDTLVISVGSQGAAGLTQVAVPLSGFGEVLSGGAGAAQTLTGGAGHDILMAGAHGDSLVGGAGNDILVAGPGETWMTGGAGVNTFVMQFGSGPTYITDFTPGADRLDLTDWLMLRNPGQLSITPTANGATVSYFDEVIHITSSHGGPLGEADLFPGGLIGPDRVLILTETPSSPPPPPPPGGELILGTPGNDTLIGGAGNDTIFAGAGDDSVMGGGGANEIWGEAGNNTLIGGDGDDTIFGGTGDDSIRGGGGDDLIDLREGGNNVVWGVSGNNTIYGGAGDDTINGSVGNNLIDVSAGGNNTVWALAGDDTIIGGAGNDTIGAGNGNNLIDLREGGDNVVSARPGNDTIYGGAGNDSINGGVGDNFIDMSAGGNNTVWARAGDDTIIGGAGDDRIGGGTGNNFIDVSAGGNNVVYGRPGDDTLIGGAGNDTLWGGAGNNLIDASAGGDNRIWGRAGSDTIIGGAGDDTITAGSGDNILTGGGGADVFVFWGRNEGDTMITDFDAADTLRLNTWIWREVGVPYTDPLSAQDVVDTFGAINADGDAVLDFGDLSITLQGYTLDDLADQIVIA